MLYLPSIHKTFHFETFSSSFQSMFALQVFSLVILLKFLLFDFNNFYIYFLAVCILIFIKYIVSSINLVLIFGCSYSLFFLFRHIVFFFSMPALSMHQVVFFFFFTFLSLF